MTVIVRSSSSSITMIILICTSIGFVVVIFNILTLSLILVLVLIMILIAIIESDLYIPQWHCQAASSCQPGRRHLCLSEVVALGRELHL